MGSGRFQKRLANSADRLRSAADCVRKIMISSDLRLPDIGGNDTFIGGAPDIVSGGGQPVAV